MRIMLAFPTALAVVFTMWAWSNSNGTFGTRTRHLLALYAKLLVCLIVLLVYAILIFGGKAVGETVALLF